MALASIYDTFSIRGWIESERVSTPPIQKLIAELLHNSLEVIRLAKTHSPIKAKIEIKCFVNSHLIPTKIEINDYATSHTGFTNLSDKKAFRLFDHIGSRSGFSGYGIGGKYAAMLLGNKIEFNTINNSNLPETMTWNIKHAITYDSLGDSLEYSFNPWLSFPEPFKTGTSIVISNLTDSYSNLETGNYLLSKLAHDVSNLFVKLDTSIPIHYTLETESKQLVSELITPSKIHGNRKRVFHFSFFRHKTLGTKSSYIYDDSTDSYYTYYNNQKTDNFSRKKVLKLNLTHHYEKISDLRLILSMDSEYSIEKTGFYTFRKVEGGFTTRTNLHPLRFKWKQMTTHPILAGYFRGIIEYDQFSDAFLQSDKFKSTSDERIIDLSLRFNILKLTNLYSIDLPTDSSSDSSSDSELDEHSEHREHDEETKDTKATTATTSTEDTEDLIDSINSLLDNIETIPEEKYMYYVQLLLKTSQKEKNELLEYQMKVLLDHYGIRPILLLLKNTYSKTL